MKHLDEDLFDEHKPLPTEREDRWWYKVYYAVIAFTVLILLLLYAFSQHFTA